MSSLTDNFFKFIKLPPRIKTVSAMALLVFVTLFYLGILGVYKASLTLKDMIPIKGTIKNKGLNYTERKGGRNYQLVFTLEEIDYKIAINTDYDNETQAKSDSTFNLLEIGEKYIFYLDPTVSIISNQKTAINEIHKEDKCIFKTSNRRNLYGGLSFIILSIVGILVIYKNLIK